MRFSEINRKIVEGYKLQLERDADMMVLNITDTATGKRTEVRGKAGYETNGYDKNDKLHQLLDKISKTANISELMNGEPVGINPKHPDGASAKKATTKAFNEAKGGLPVKTLKGLYHVGTMDSSKKRDGFEGAGLSVSTHPDAWKQIARGHVTGDTHSATKEGNKFLDAHSLSDAHNKQIKQWAIKNGYLEQQETVTVCYYDDEMEDDLCSTFDSMADAEAEYDDELEHMDVTVDKGGIVPTDKLKKETRQNRIDSTGVLEFVLPIFAEQQGLDGVWWQDNLDVQRYSAPRGVIVPSKIKSWKFTVKESIAFNENVSALASELEAKYNLKSLFLGDMASRNAIELHSIIVNREDQGKGTGSKVMQELIKYADDNGKIMVLDPGLLDKQHGTTSQSRLRKFYKQFGFIDNKGRNKNYEFRNLMIRYPQSNESVNEVSKEEFDAIRNGYVDIEFDKKWWPLSSDYPLIKHIGEAIGATSWTSWGKVGVPWSETEMIGGGGTYMLKGDFGHILLDASKSFRPDGITMAQISTSNRGAGVGVKVMNAIKSYADQKNLPFTVYKVTNKKFFDKFEWLTKTGVDTYEYNPSKNESINEALNNPYPFNLKGPGASHNFTATAKTPNGELRMDFQDDNYDQFTIDFSIGNEMGKTEAGDEFRVFATVVAMMKKWISTIGIEHVESFDFGANKDEHASDGRAKLYTRFAKKLASQLGWKLEQSTTANGGTAFFKLTNPKPVKRDDEYWDALDENVTEAAGVGRVVKGVNTTVDVGPDEIIKQVKKFGNDVDRDGKPNKHLR